MNSLRVRTDLRGCAATRTVRAPSHRDFREPVRPMRAFASFLGLFLVAFVVVALFTYPAWLLLHPHFDFPFHRIGERIGMLALLLGFVAVARRLKLAHRARLGYGVAP